MFTEVRQLLRYLSTLADLCEFKDTVMTMATVREGTRGVCPVHVNAADHPHNTDNHSRDPVFANHAWCLSQMAHICSVFGWAAHVCGIQAPCISMESV